MVDSLVASLSVREKVGQLLMPWLLGNFTATASDAFDSAAVWVDELGIGGIVISIGSPLDAASKLNRLQTRSDLPLIVAADLEYGAAMRFGGATAFPMAMGVGASGRELDAYQMGRVTALEARAVGVHWTFSPVADLNNNPDNPIINTRSFGEDPGAVSPLIAAYIRGAEEHGLFTTAKHFPGHGDTGIDSHLALPRTTACWDRLDAVELVPFRRAIASGVTSVMTAHLAVPCFDGVRALPATLSPAVMRGVLRDSLGFDGVVVTDALTMGAIVNEWGVGESAVRAFLAGSDLLLYPADLRAARDAMVEAVHTGRVALGRLDQSVRRLLHLKERAGLFARRTVALDSVATVIGHRDHQTVADDIAERALTLVQRGPLDAIRAARSRVTVVAYAEETNHSIANTLMRELRALGDTVGAFRLYPASGPASYDSVRTILGRSPRTVFAISVRPISGRGHVDLPASLATLIAATESTRPTTLVSFGSPYLLSQLPAFEGTFLLAWNGVPATERAVARALAGGTAITGRSPITLSERFPRGHGIQVPAQ